MHKLLPIVFVFAACGGMSAETTVPTTSPAVTTSLPTPSITSPPTPSQSAFTSGSTDREVAGSDYTITVPTAWSDQMNDGVLVLATPPTDEDDDFIETIEVHARTESAEEVFDSLGIDVDRIPVPVANSTAAQSVVIDGAATTVFTIVVAEPVTYLIIYRAGDDYLVWLSDVEMIIGSFAAN